MENNSAPRLQPLTKSQWSEKQAEILAKMNFGGKVANIFTTAVRHPEMMEAWNHFGMYILRGSSLPARDREILILRTAWLVQCEYAFSQHALVGKSCGLAPEEIRLIIKGPDEPGWDFFDTLLLRAADELHLESAITDATWNALARRYSEKQLFDLIMTVGQYTTASMLMKTLRVPLDDGLPGFREILK